MPKTRSGKRFTASHSKPVKRQRSPANPSPAISVSTPPQAASNASTSKPVFEQYLGEFVALSGNLLDVQRKLIEAYQREENNRKRLASQNAKLTSAGSSQTESIGLQHLPTLPQETIDEVRKHDKIFDLRKLLRANSLLDPASFLPGFIVDTAALTVRRRDSEVREIDSYESWNEAFHVYMQVRGHYDPSMFAPLLGYSNNIRTLALLYPIDVWLDYDGEFRTRMAGKRSKLEDWFKLDRELLEDSLSRFPQPPNAFRQIDPNDNRHYQICKNFNFGRCLVHCPQSRVHICLVCFSPHHSHIGHEQATAAPCGAAQQTIKYE